MDFEGETAMPSAKLLMKYNETIRGEVALERSELTIGRAPDNDLVIDDLAVSAHHARIAKIQSVFFIEDLGSTNGTFVNDVKVDEQALQDRDMIAIAGHRFVFDLGRDTTAEANGELEQTVVMTRKRPEAPQALQKSAILLIMSGKTDQGKYQLNDSVVLVGSDEDATVKLTGWFAPKRAALFRRDRSGYSLYPGPDAKQILCNSVPLIGPTPLNDGDLIEVAGVRLCFYLKTKI